MHRWLIPLAYTVVAAVAGLLVPRLEHAYFNTYEYRMSVGAALAFFSAVGSGMLALTGVVFAITFVIVQFGALAYSPRVVLLFANSPTMFHALGMFFATFIYSLGTLIWVDRPGAVDVPLISTWIAGVLLLLSLVMFVTLIRKVQELQVHNVLRSVGAQGRAVIRKMFVHLPEYRGEVEAEPIKPELGTPVQTIRYSGEPLTIASVEVARLVKLAADADAVIAIECGVGETLVEGTTLFNVYGAAHPLPEAALMRGIRLATTRTYEQDPKYAIRLLVDIAIRTLSPAINDPTTAVQALDQIEDLLRRLGRRELDAGNGTDPAGRVRLIVPVPSWEDYLALSFDEIRRYGANSLQVIRRLRSALVGLSEAVADGRREVVLKYLDHLNFGVSHADLDEEDRASALEEDRQGLGLSRKRSLVKPQQVALDPLSTAPAA